MGLGDVYKRQELQNVRHLMHFLLLLQLLQLGRSKHVEAALLLVYVRDVESADSTSLMATHYRR